MSTTSNKNMNIFIKTDLSFVKLAGDERHLAAQHIEALIDVGEGFLEARNRPSRSAFLKKGMKFALIPICIVP